MSKWRRASLWEVSRVFNGKTPPKAEQRAQGHPVLKIKDVSDLGQFRGTFDSFVDPIFAQKFAAATIQTGDILILNAAHNAAYVGSKTFRADGATAGALATGEWLIIRADRSVLDPGFAHHWVNERGTRRAMSELVKGIHLYPKDVERLPMPLPPVAEQRRIAEVLDRADALRTQQRGALARLDGFAEAIFAHMFMRTTSASNGAATEALGDHLRFVTSGGRGWAQYYADRGSRFIRSLDVRMNHIADEDAVFVMPPDNAEARRTRVAAGDVLLTITGSRIGRVSAVPAQLDGAYISQHVAILRPDCTVLLPAFLAFFLSSNAGGQRQIARTQYGQTKPGLNFKQIRSFELPVPPLRLQEEFGRRLATIDRLRSKLDQSLARLDGLFGSLQHRAFRGEL